MKNVKLTKAQKSLLSAFYREDSIYTIEGQKCIAPHCAYKNTAEALVKKGVLIAVVTDSSTYYKLSVSKPTEDLFEALAQIYKPNDKDIITKKELYLLHSADKFGHFESVDTETIKSLMSKGLIFKVTDIIEEKTYYRIH